MKKTLTIIKTLSLTLTVSLVSLPLVKAQEKEVEVSVKDLPKISISSAMGGFHADFSGKNVSTTFLISNLNKWLGTDSNHTFELIDTKTDDLGIKRSIVQHYYKNIKVADEQILIHEKEGKVIYVNGEFTGNINLVANTSLPKERVESIIHADMGISEVSFSDFEKVIAKAYGNKEINLYSTSRICARSRKGLQAYVYYIDNETGKIIKKLDKIYRENLKPVIKNISIDKKVFVGIMPTVSPLLDTPSTSTTYYKGNQNITVDSYNGGFRLKDAAQNIHTRNATDWGGDADSSTGELVGNITEYTNNTANFTSDATKPAVEVHWAMEIARNYYLNRHSRNSYDNNGSIIKNYYNVNFNADSPDKPYDGTNAAAVDVQGIVCMLYGNGATDMFGSLLQFYHPIVGIDVAGHEYSHLIVSRTANLAYQRESGALNESFADMMGAAVEFYSNVNPNWTIGEGIPNSQLLPGLGTYMRNMADPKAAVTNKQPNTYQGSYWKNASASCVPDENNDQCGVHTNSGVGNYWFYLLSMGGSGINDNGTSFNVAGITIQKAEKIAYRTLVTYLTSNSGYIEAYNGSIQAAKDLYGIGSNEVQQVENAWCAVGLGNCANQLAVNESIKQATDKITIYPNPIHNGQFTIVSNSKGNAEYEIFDLSGKLIKTSEKLQKGVNKININQIQAGVYVVKVNMEGNIISKKIVVE